MSNLKAKRQFFNKPGIYKITNIQNGNFYIGSALYVSKRIQIHKSNLKANRHVNKHLQSAYNKYQQENFIYEVLEYIDDHTQLTSKEQYYIDSLNPEYNILTKAYSSCGYKHSEQNIQRFKDRGRLTSKPVMQIDMSTLLVVKEWPSIRAVVIQMGIDRRLLSKALIGEYEYIHGFIWKYKGEECNVCEIGSKRRFPIIQLTIKGVFIREWRCADDISKEYGIHLSNLYVALRKPTRICAGFRWKRKFEI